MIFADDTVEALTATATLVNSATAPDGLTDVADLDAFVARFPYTGRRDRTPAEVEQIRKLRPVLRQLWSGDEEAVVALCNDLLRRYRALPQLVRHDQWPWHLHATAADDPLATRIAVEAAMAMVDLLRAGELDRLRRCAADDCDGVVVDWSKNRSRRYCERGCGNRTNVAAYRARRRAEGVAS